MRVIVNTNKIKYQNTINSYTKNITHSRKLGIEYFVDSNNVFFIIHAVRH